MDNILNIIKALSVISVVSAAIFLLLPKGTMTVSFKYAMGIFTLSAIISAFSFSSLNAELPEFSSVQTAVYGSSQNIDIQTATFVIEKLLTDAKIPFEEVTVITDNSEAECINITKAKVRLVCDEDIRKATELVLKETGITLVGG